MEPNGEGGGKMGGGKLVVTTKEAREAANEVEWTAEGEAIWAMRNAAKRASKGGSEGGSWGGKERGKEGGRDRWMPYEKRQEKWHERRRRRYNEGGGNETGAEVGERVFSE